VQAQVVLVGGMASLAVMSSSNPCAMSGWSYFEHVRFWLKVNYPEVVPVGGCMASGKWLSGLSVAGWGKQPRQRRCSHVLVNAFDDEPGSEQVTF
jgi:hypothetical protein